MAFPRECYDAKTLDFMTHVLESAWRDVEHRMRGRNLDYTALRTVCRLGSWLECETETLTPTT